MSFINPGDLYVVVVKADKAGEILVEGLPPGIYEISYITGEGAHELSPFTIHSQDQTLNTTIPAAGVLTIYRLNRSKINNLIMQVIVNGFIFQPR